MIDKNYQGPERRRFPRIPFWYIVRYKIANPNVKSHSQLLTSKSKNISLGGILLETNHYYDITTTIEVELDVPIDTKNHVYAKVIGSVVRCNSLGDGKSYDTAVQFISIADEYKKNVMQLINAFL